MQGKTASELFELYPSMTRRSATPAERGYLSYHCVNCIVTSNIYACCPRSLFWHDYDCHMQIPIIIGLFMQFILISNHHHIQSSAISNHYLSPIITISYHHHLLSSSISNEYCVFSLKVHCRRVAFVKHRSQLSLD